MEEKSSAMDGSAPGEAGLDPLDTCQPDEPLSCET